MKGFKELSINTACSEASGSASGSCSREGSGSGDGGEGFRDELEKKHKRASTQSQDGN